VLADDNDPIGKLLCETSAEEAEVYNNVSSSIFY